MKQTVDFPPAPALSNVIFRLAIVGGLFLGCAYVFLMVCASAIKLLF